MAARLTTQRLAAASLPSARQPSLASTLPLVCSSTASSRHHHDHNDSRQRRPFLTAAHPPQAISVRRVLPYDRHDLFGLIADVDAYAAFLPYCAASRVTAWSPPDARGRRWPARADLTVGFGALTQTYTSQLRCAPGEYVQATSGEDAAGGGGGGGSGAGVFRSLVTRWTVRSVGDAAGAAAGALGAGDAPAAASTAAAPSGDGARPWTEVDLSIRYQFANPLLSVTMASVADSMAGMMIGAFEERAAQLFGRQRR